MLTHSTERTSRWRGAPLWHVVYFNGEEVYRAVNRGVVTAFKRGFYGYVNGEPVFPTPYDHGPRHKMDLTTYPPVFSTAYEEGWETAEEMTDAETEG